MNWYDETYGLLVTEYGEELTEDFLEHHGVPGQKWGVRNAEWYPISDYEKHLSRTSGVSKEDSKRATRSVTEDSKRVARLAKESSGKTRKIVNHGGKSKKTITDGIRERVLKETSEDRRERILKDPGLLKKHIDEFSDAEVDKAIRNFERLSKLENFENRKNNKFINEVNARSNVMRSLINTYNTTSEFMKLANNLIELFGGR